MCFTKALQATLKKKIHNLPDVELTTDIPVIDRFNSLDINYAFNIINTEEARITYWLGNDRQYALFLCEAYQRQFIWPAYVYILRHNPDILTNILVARTSCTHEELLNAAEGVFMVDYRLHVEDDTELFSGWKFYEFQQRYAEKLKDFSNHINLIYYYANSFYNQVWTFALAINNSLPIIYSQNLSFADYTLWNTSFKTITNVIKTELVNVSFQGASALIEFNEKHEVSVAINIFQVQHEKLQLIAIFDPFSMEITRLKNFPQHNSIPPDTFETVYDLLPTWLGGCILAAQGLLFVVITINLVLMLIWRERYQK